MYLDSKLEMITKLAVTTGRISRLSGTGTKSLSITEHGPHVDQARFPDAALVELQVYFPGLKKSATITRKISAPKKPKIVPADAAIKAAFEQIAEHPEIALSRRDILRFILVEPTRRAEEVQTILKLDEIGDARAALNTAQNRVNAVKRSSEAQVNANRSSLLGHAQIPVLKADDLLAAVNVRRKLLGLALLDRLGPDTKLDAGLTSSAPVPQLNKQSALRDLAMLSEQHKALPDAAKNESDELLEALDTLAADAALLAALRRRTFVQQGIDLVDGPHCPLCDLPWESERHLRDHLAAKLEKSQEAERLQTLIFANAGAIERAISGWAATLATMRKLVTAQGDAAFGSLIDRWSVDLAKFSAKLRSLDGLYEVSAVIKSGWYVGPKGFDKALAAFSKSISDLPDQSATIDAQTFLTTAQIRLNDYREAMRADKAADIAVAAATRAYTIYCEVMDAELEALYDDVQEDFSTYYRLINEDDEGKFTAKLSPSAGKLDFDVNFYERGLYPPGAFHSEGHQDSMGVCLYLALMKRLFGDQFTFALLDDVVMSVDSGHRYQFCKLLKTHFKDTQFIITTHDRTWAEQMKSAGLVTGKTSLAFHSWSIESGPLVESNVEVWDEIAAALAKNKIGVAAGTLRRHLEYVSRNLADQLGAPVTFRADGGYELNDLLPPVLARFKALCGRAADAAQSWGNEKAKTEAATLKTKLSTSNASSSVEQWAINKAVHYNEWENFGKRDFEPVAAAYRELLTCFKCESCDAWLYVSTTPVPTRRC
ncbi:chromosome segregation protein SMC [Bradyrhizobium sp. AUGA SZCCT0182]|uniref:chromosome segregation protein SMC n=1 Tax=Bradyrhizobium sp. AUGA SZCCT0182 TaxID=2807667 RepID=UPI001BA93E7F|nr:chromosome segregation protein SMC [Bradyrhizobium sp. AUGA SZCCT0182]MBR1235591.1 chromosome segregation protein SMC [Bradyrhizobium sp. AUGA SZCCT0182]